MNHISKDYGNQDIHSGWIEVNQNTVSIHLPTAGQDQAIVDFTSAADLDALIAAKDFLQMSIDVWEEA